MQLVLASASPRRAEIMHKIGLEFSVQVVEVEESGITGSTPGEMVCALALRKAHAVAESGASGLILGADTVVVLDKKVLGKPASPFEAEHMLQCLSGRAHKVLTGVALINTATGKTLHGVETTRVNFRSLSSAEIRAYVATGEPMDKAGAYGIQEKGATLVKRIEGCFFNVMGLPVVRVVQMLKQQGFNLYADWGVEKSGT